MLLLEEFIRLLSISQAEITFTLPLISKDKAAAEVICSAANISNPEKCAEPPVISYSIRFDYSSSLPSMHVSLSSPNN